MHQISFKQFFLDKKYKILNLWKQKTFFFKFCIALLTITLFIQYIFMGILSKLSIQLLCINRDNPATLNVQILNQIGEQIQ